MGIRLSLGRFLLRLGTFIQSLPVVVMRPADLVEFSRQSYLRPPSVESWAEEGIVESGLKVEERDLLEAIPFTTGELLLLGVGGGREAIPLAHMGFQVTGVDYVPGMVQRARENAERRGLKIRGLVQEISQLQVQSGAYDVVWLSSGVYSCVPTRRRRVAMVRRIADALKPGGYFLFQFHRDPTQQPTRKTAFIRRAIAALTLGNLAYEPGDILWGNVEFLHAFASEEAVRAELKEGGLEVVCFQTERNPVRCGVVCRKRPATGQVNNM